jgi:hypothetical protein
MVTVRLLAASLLLAAAPAAAEEVTADALVARNLAARGGGQALAALKSIRFEGRMIFPGDFELTYRELRARGAGSDSSARLDMTVQGLTLVQAYDGRQGWRINPFSGRRDAERMSEDEARSVADASLIEGPLLAAARQGSRVAYLGREDFDGTLGYKVKVTEKDGDEFTYLLDPDTFLEIKVTESRRIRGAQQVSETELGDYEKVGGVYFPMSVESWQQGQPNQRQRIMIATGTANPAVDPAMFRQPVTGAAVPPGGTPPDASNAPPGGETEPQGETPDPSSPPKDR